MPRGAVGLSGEGFRILALCVQGCSGERGGSVLLRCVDACLAFWHERVDVAPRMLCSARQLARRVVVVDCE